MPDRQVRVVIGRFLLVLTLLFLLHQKSLSQTTDSFKEDHTSEQDSLVIFLKSNCSSTAMVDSTGSLTCWEALTKLGDSDLDEFKKTVHIFLDSYWAKAQYDSLRYYAKKLVIQVQSIRQWEFAGEIWEEIGNSYTSERRFDSAYFFLSKALHIYDSIGHQSISIYKSLARTNTISRGNLERSLDYLHTAKKIGQTSESHRDLAKIYYDIAVTYYRIDLYGDSVSYSANDSAVAYLEHSTKLLESDQIEADNRRIGINARLKGFIEMNLSDFVASEISLKKALQYLEAQEDETLLLELYYYLSQLHLRQNQLEQSLEWASTGFSLAVKLKLPHEQRPPLSTMYEISLKKGDFESALGYYGRQIELKDSIFSQESKVRSQQLAVQHESRVKDFENKLLTKEKEIQTLKLTRQTQIIKTIIIVAGTLLILLVAAYFGARKYKLQNRKLNLSNAKVSDQAKRLLQLDEDKSRFFINIAHDLRSPLTLIISAFDLIKRNDFEILDKASKEVLQTGKANTKRLLYLANEIMELSKLEKGILKLNRKPVSLEPYLRMLTLMFKSAADAKSISLDFTATLERNAMVFIDTDQFEKILYNLVSNAIKFTPTKGQVKVVLSLATMETVQISISDTGPGMPQESLAYIFDRYFQGNNDNNHPQPGVGIGLAIAKELSELHEGSLEVSSLKDQGSTFIVSLPVVRFGESSLDELPRSHALESILSDSLAPTLSSSKKEWIVSDLSTTNTHAKSILIVEDHKEIRKYLTSILANDHRIYEAGNGNEAVQVLEKQKIDLVITDLMMPEMSGFQLVEHLKSSKGLKRIPIVVLSARTDRDEKLDLLTKGITDIMYKPFDREELQVKVQNILTRESTPTVNTEKLHQTNANEFDKTIIAKLERLIMQNIDNPNLSVLDLANEMAASERKLYRMVKKIAGMTPYDLIREVRWKYLENHLENNYVDSINKAAQLIGMTSGSYFKEQYEKRFGKSIDQILNK